MDGEIITYKNYPEVHEWLLENVEIWYNNEWVRYGYKFTKQLNDLGLFVMSNGKIDSNTSLVCASKPIKYPFGVINGSFFYDCHKNITSLKNSPKYVRGDFTCEDNVNLKTLEGCPSIIGNNFSFDNCTNLQSFKGFPKIVNGSIYLNYTKLSTEPTFKNKYNNYIDAWLELLESVSEDNKWEYINNYKDKVDGDYSRPIIPKEVINKYKIDFLLKK